MMHVKIVAAAAGMFVGLSLSSQAAMLLPGGSGLEPVQLPGATPVAELSRAFNFGGLNGAVLSWVVRDPANPLGGLSFYYQVISAGQESVSRFSSSGFGIIPGAPVQMSTITAPFDISLPGSFGIAPTTADRSPGTGDVVGFDFGRGSQIGTGQWSLILVVNTPFQNFGAVTGSVIGNNSVDVTMLGPVVPEPSTIVAASLLLLPLGASALRVVRKTQ